MGSARGGIYDPGVARPIVAVIYVGQGAGAGPEEEKVHVQIRELEENGVIRSVSERECGVNILTSYQQQQQPPSGVPRHRIEVAGKMFEFRQKRAHDEGQRYHYEGLHFSQPKSEPCRMYTAW